jgi:hypothetical protein
MPVSKKVIVATNERHDNLPKPHTPWPLVQPLPNEVPSPTSNPPAASNHPGKFGRAAGTLPENP